MRKKWTIILAVVGLIMGLIHPGNMSFGVGMVEAIAYAIPWAAFFALIGLAIDYFSRSKKDESS